MLVQTLYLTAVASNQSCDGPNPSTHSVTKKGPLREVVKSLLQRNGRKNPDYFPFGCSVSTRPSGISCVMNVSWYWPFAQSSAWSWNHLDFRCPLWPGPTT